MLICRYLGLRLWEDLLSEALHAERTLLCTATNQTPHERFFPFRRRSMLEASLPSWLVTPGYVLLRKFVRSEHEPMCEEVKIFDVNPPSSLVRFPHGRKTTASTSDLASSGDPAPQPVSTDIVADNISRVMKLLVIRRKIRVRVKKVLSRHIKVALTLPVNLDEQTVRLWLKIRRPPDRNGYSVLCPTLTGFRRIDFHCGQ